MRDDEPMKWTPLFILGSLLILWAFIKGFIIGYYPDELVPQIVLPLAAGGALLGIDRLRSGRKS